MGGLRGGTKQLNMNNFSEAAALGGAGSNRRALLQKQQEGTAATARRLHAGACIDREKAMHGPTRTKSLPSSCCRCRRRWWWWASKAPDRWQAMPAFMQRQRVPTRRPPPPPATRRAGPHSAGRSPCQEADSNMQSPHNKHIQEKQMAVPAR